jgi:hypothetical protein
MKNLSVLVGMWLFGVTSLLISEGWAFQVNGIWTPEVPRMSGQSDAGNHPPRSYQSEPGVMTIDTDDGKWIVSVRMNEDIWPDGLTFWVRRISSGRAAPGSGRPQIQGGLSYQEVRNYNQVLFSGEGRLTGIKVQYRIDGMSIRVPPAVYGLSIVYTSREIQ